MRSEVESVIDLSADIFQEYADQEVLNGEMVVDDR